MKHFISSRIKQLLFEDYRVKYIIDIIKEENPDIFELGSKEDYINYLDTVFPDSLIPNILFHETTGDWYFNQQFSKDKIGKTDYGYYGKGFYFSTTQGLSSYGDKTIFVKVNVKKLNTKANTHDIAPVILKSYNKNESKQLALDWLNEQIQITKNRIIDLNNNNFNKHTDIPKNVDFDEYWESKRKTYIVNNRAMLDEYLQQKDNINTVVDYYYSFDAFSTGEDLNVYQEIMVRDPDNILILGSNQDLKGFEKYMM